jgi:hypothetical protein
MQRHRRGRCFGGVLTTSNVGGTTFGKLFTRNLDGQVYAQPLYVGGVNGKNLVYVATEHNTVYAFDADDLRVTAPPVWQKNFGPSVPAADTGSGLLTPEIGITSTPVIVLGYDATTLAQTAVHVDTPDGSEGGIWHGGVGLNADENGDVFYVSGNGTFDGVSNFGNSVVRLHPDGAAGPANGLTVASFFTPFDSSDANDGDFDLGSTGGMLIPGTQLLVTGDKRGFGFLVNKNQLGGIVDQDSQIVQRFQGSTRGMFGGAAFYKKGAGGRYYLWGTGDRLKSFAFDGTQFVLPAQVNTRTLIGYPGGQLAVSADGDTAGTAVLWTVRSKRTSAGLAQSAGAGVLQAFDALDVTHELWSSDAKPSDMLGSIAKFAPPTVANGRVFVGTASNQLVAYGLFAGNAPPVTVGPDGGSDASASNDAGSSTSDGDAATDASSEAGSAAAPTWSQIYALYIGPGTPGHCSGTGGCHTTLRGGFTCGATKSACFQGLVAAGLVTPANGSASPLGVVGQSPLVWLGGGMPLDSAAQNPAAAAAVQAWAAAGALNN